MLILSGIGVLDNCNVTVGFDVVEEYVGFDIVEEYGNLLTVKLCEHWHGDRGRRG